MGTSLHQTDRHRAEELQKFLTEVIALGNAVSEQRAVFWEAFESFKEVVLDDCQNNVSCTMEKKIHRRVQTFDGGAAVPFCQEFD